MDPELNERLVRIEGLLSQLIKDVRASKVRGIKRSRAVGERAVEHAQKADPRYRPTDLQRAAARRILNAVKRR
jgi:hypothetical protein